MNCGVLSPYRQLVETPSSSSDLGVLQTGGNFLSKRILNATANSSKLVLCCCCYRRRLSQISSFLSVICPLTCAATAVGLRSRPPDLPLVTPDAFRARDHPSCRPARPPVAGAASLKWRIHLDSMSTIGFLCSIYFAERTTAEAPSELRSVSQSVS